MEESGQLYAQPLYSPGKYPPEGRWAAELVLKTWRGEKSCFYWDVDCDTSVAQPVTSLYTDCAILTPYIYMPIGTFRIHHANILNK
jgi:hypothetical protein